ncbi:MAG TPA: phosphotransferase [Planctomycetales bacterium]|jgi:aminoglycoside phosphotransferase (APT) family kinase protein|nr:phosphotransferase [Planctomycetales bacterium]
MLELTPANAADYLRRQGWVGPGPVNVEALSGGVSNAVLRVRTTESVFILKQSRPQLRTRDAWFSDLDRVYREQEVMQVLQPLLPPNTVPQVLFSDRAQYVFAMSSAPDAAIPWKESLLEGVIDFDMGEKAGAFLGRMHDATARNPALIDAFRDRAVFVQLRVDPYYRRIQERRPEVASAVAGLIDGLLSSREALCHGDYSPKNILVHEHGFMLVDYETAHQGDPAMDLGFFLSHLLLKAARRPADRLAYFDLTRAFWRGYQSQVGAWSGDHALTRRGIAHCGLCLLARIDGTSPVEYLPEELKREAVRRLGRSFLLEQPATWEEALTLTESAFAPLGATEASA